MNIRSWIFLAVAPMLFLVQCTQDPIAAGGTGEETTNGITAAFIDVHGTPVANAVVRVRPATYVSQSVSPGMPKRTAITGNTLTDADGRFVIRALDAGAYCVEVSDSVTGGGVLLTVNVDGAPDTADLGTHTLRPTGSLRGSIVLDSQTESSVSAQIYGLERIVQIDSTAGTFSFTDLPEGTYTVRVAPVSHEYGAHDIADQPVSSGGLTDAGTLLLVPFDKETYSSWQHVASVKLNTTATGANITDDVTMFPLLVRLSAANFDFSAAHGKGFDIRFAKIDGTRLRYEIERWDPGAQQAEIWVMLDTVYGSDSTQTMQLYWGNAIAADMSDGPAVFDTTVGYVSVYHLNETPSGDGSRSIHDQTANANHGTPGGAMTGADLVAGTVGRAVRFDGIDDVIIARSWYLPQYSFSFWTNADRVPWVCTVAQQSTKVLSYNHDNFEFDWAHDSSDYLQSHAHQVQVSDTTVDWRRAQVQRTLSANTWYYIAGTYDGQIMTVWVNGQLEQATAAAPPYTSEWQFRPLGIGGYDTNMRNFGGVIDEVEIAQIPWSSARIKLQYENQKPDQKLITIR